MPSNLALTILLGTGVAFGILSAAAVVRHAARLASAAWQEPRLGTRITNLAAAFVPSLAWLSMLLAIFRLSGSAGVVGVGLDASWPLVVEHGADHDWQWGRDLIYTFGPLGFLHSAAGLGGFVIERSLSAWCHALLAAYVGWRCGLALPSLVRVAFWLWLVAFPPTDVLLVAMAGCVLLLPPPTKGGAIIVAAFAVMALVKFTIFTSASAVVFFVALHEALQRRWKRAVLGPALFVASLLLSWLVCGQSLADVPAYLRYSMEIASGFGTMSSRPLGPVLAWALALAAFILLLAAASLWRTARPLLPKLVACLSVLACAFVSWKHGFTRADIHVVEFLAVAFPYACLLALLAPPALSHAGIPARAWQAAPLLALVLCLPPLSMTEVGALQPFARIWPALKNATSTALSTLQTDTRLPGIDDAPSKNLEEWRLPEIRSLLNHDSVDVINFQQGYALINGLNYRPRPVFQSYTSYTPRLQEFNRAHYLSTAPAHVLLRLESIDSRLPWLDDGPLMLDLVTRWVPHFREKGFLVLMHDPGVEGEWVDVHTGVGQWNRIVKMPASAKTALRAFRLDAPRSLAGRVKQFLYHGAQATIILRTADGERINRAFIPEMARLGVLLSPWMGNVDELLSWQSGHGGREVTSFELRPWPGYESEFKQKFSYTIMEWRPQDRQFPVLASLQPYPFLPSFPHVIRPAMEVRPLLGSEACCARAPTRLEFTVPPTATGLSGRFMAECGPVQAEPERVGIHVRLLGQGGAELFRHDRHLQPQTRPQDAAAQLLNLDFPPAADSSPRTLILESSTNMERRRALSWWGPLAWK
jgi:hypothetical protein